MSVKITGRVWDLDLTHPQQSILLALADHADHDGGSVFPSVGFTAWKAGYSKRQVRRIMGDLRELGLLEVVAEARDHRPVEYRIRLDAGRLKPAYVADREDKLSARAGGVTRTTDRADIATSPEPSVNRHGSTPSGVDPMSGLVDSLIDYWRERCHHPKAKASDERRRKVAARVKEAGTPEEGAAEVRLGIDGAARAAFVTEAGERKDDIELVCRSRVKLDSFIARAEGQARNPPTAREWMERELPELAVTDQSLRAVKQARQYGKAETADEARAFLHEHWPQLFE